LSPHFELEFGTNIIENNSSNLVLCNNEMTQWDNQSITKNNTKTNYHITFTG